jgi:PAS domain S-box-containing protein
MRHSKDPEGSSPAADPSAARALELQEATARLAAALTAGEVIGILLSIGEQMFNASASLVYLGSDGGELERAGSRGNDGTGEWRIAPAGLAQTLGDRASVWLEERGSVDASPVFCDAPALLQAVVALPFHHRDRTLGGLVLGFDQPRSFSPDERRWIEAVATQAAVALERARLLRASRLAEESQRHLVAELSETVRLNDLLTGVLAHDLRNPLGGIMTAAELAIARDDGEKLAKPLSRIVASGRRMGRMVSQLLDFTRIRVGEGMPLEPKRFNVGSLVRHVVEELDALRLQVSIKLDERGDTTGVWDEDRLGQVFSNLVGNALQHGTGDVRIEIDGSDPNTLCVRVHNGGVIPAEQIPKLFHPMATREHREPTKSGGLGLGLFITEHIAKAHGGSVALTSSAEDGTTFSVSLPRQTMVAASSAPPLVAAPDELKDRRRVELHLRESEDRFRVLVSSIKDYAIFMLDTEGHVQSWNIGAQLLKGYTSQEVVGRHLSLFYTPEDRQAGRPQALLDQALQQGRVEDEGWRVRKDGRRFWADVVITALRDSSGRPLGFAKVTRDLTERKHTEERLRGSEERLRLIVDSVRDYAIFMLDPKGRVLTWNSGAERIKGYTAAEIIGQHFSRFYDEEEVRAGKCDRALEVTAREGRIEEEGWRVRKDGSRFWASVVITALRNETGELVGFTKVTRDLTQRRKLEEERIRLAQAEEAIRLRDEFLSIVSHELKTPLTGLRLQLESLQHRIDSTDQSITLKLQRASHSSDRLAQLVESLLDVSRFSTGQFVLSREPFDLAEEVTHQLENLTGPAAKAGCELRMNVGPSIVGAWDRVRVEQVVTNLVANAMKYGAGKPIDVSLVQQGAHAVLEVRDHGPGIPGPDFARLFQRFERVGSIRHYGGLGLGLYFVREIVAAHGGSVAASNAAGGGASFIVRLPIGPQPNLERPHHASGLH